ncbi:F-box only protein 27-like [Ovis canadensis]|uniref:F-box only protein 27-like n=1 Tax=Ovis canadensis TaxID=37174 RepID=UPI0037510E51
MTVYEGKRPATKPGEETMCTSASTNWPVGVCSLKPEPEEILGPNQLPIEMLQKVLSYLPPRTLLRHCRLVCRRWRDVVDGWDLWRSILPWRHPDLWPVIRTCLPPADAPGPCILGRFCEHRPIGCNLLRNPRGLGGFQKWTVLSREDDWTEKENLEVMPRAYMQSSFLSAYRRYHKKQVLDLEKEGLWRELLDSGNIEICVSDWRNDRQGIDCIYQLTVHLLDASQAILDHFSPLPFPIRRSRNSVSSRHGGFGAVSCFLVAQGSMRLLEKPAKAALPLTPQWKSLSITPTTLLVTASHVFSNIKKGVRFVSFERHIWDLEFRNEQYGVSLMNSSVIVRVCRP